MISHAPIDYQCPFCRLIRADFATPGSVNIPEDLIYQDEHVTAVLSLHQNPRAIPNVLVLPNEHHENMYDLPEEYAAPILRVSKLLAAAYKSAFGADGVSTRQHNEPAGSQDVWHYHLHVTARYHGDDFYHNFLLIRMDKEERAEIGSKLKTAIKAILDQSNEHKLPWKHLPDLPNVPSW
ncbi:MAG TPA: HIT family protein [Bellilinea sp.]|nr:HIT family protein [Bellilinea sp.]